MVSTLAILHNGECIGQLHPIVVDRLSNELMGLRNG
jgi:hypothetical protein